MPPIRNDNIAVMNDKAYQKAFKKSGTLNYAALGGGTSNSPW